MAKHAPKLARGYTRAGIYLFDSDDDTPVPELPVATIPAVQAPPDCISPPPSKRVTLAEAPMAKAVASAMKRESVLPKPPPPSTTAITPSEVNLFRAYAAGTYQIVSAAPTPRPAKGLWRDMHPEHIRAAPSAYARPPISTGHLNVVHDGARWRTILIKEKSKKPWPLWGRGVVDLRPHNRVPMVAGRILLHALEVAT